MKILFTLLLSIAVLCGCASAGNQSLKNETKQSVSQKIKKGMSQSAVRRLYGDPMTISFTEGGSEIWKYHFSKHQITAATLIPIVSLFSSGTTGQSKELVILFNKKGKVRKFRMSESKVDSNTGILKQ